MDVEKQLDSVIWLQEPWAEPEVSPAAAALLRACGAEPEPEPEPRCDLGDLIARSNSFPIKFPIDTVRLEKLKQSVPAETLKRNVLSTYPLLHRRALIMMANFLLYKRKYGSEVEQSLYKEMGVLQLLDRLLRQRAVTFMKAKDQYLLLTGEKGVDGWESIGGPHEKPPLVLRQCLSYDEVKLSALLAVSGYTHCINDGDRRNRGVVNTDQVQTDAVIIGVVGPRFKRVRRMEYEDLVLTAAQNTPDRGYGLADHPGQEPAAREWRKLWAHFYQIPNYSHAELLAATTPRKCSPTTVFSTRYAALPDGAVFDNTAYHRRLALILEPVLADADTRAMEAATDAYVNIIGAGLGVWRMSPHQTDVFVLSVVGHVRRLLAAARLPHVAHVNLAFIKPGKTVAAMFKPDPDKAKVKDAPRKLFLKNAAHPRGGISVQLESRCPARELAGDHAHQLLVMTYAWDGNAHPGNEFWLGKLSSSGDSAAACCTQVTELHTAHINTRLTAHIARVSAHTAHHTVPAYCRLHH